MKSNEYKCGGCNKVYEKGWSDEEAKAEAVKLHGAYVKDMAVVCDDCFVEMRRRGMF